MLGQPWLEYLTPFFDLVERTLDSEGKAQHDIVVELATSGSLKDGCRSASQKARRALVVVSFQQCQDHNIKKAKDGRRQAELSCHRCKES